MDFLSFENQFDEKTLITQLKDLEDLQKRWLAMEEAKKINQEKEQWATLWQSLDAYTADSTASAQMVLGTMEDQSWLDFLSEANENNNLYVENLPSNR